MLGAGIGGNGGRGGTSKYTCIGVPGEKGEDCGNVNIYDDIVVWAFGGGGGTGGGCSSKNLEATVWSGGGGSGFPAAGIGGGGAGGTTGDTNESGSGFSAGCPEYNFYDYGGKDGKVLDELCVLNCGTAGAYYNSYAAFDFTRYNTEEGIALIGDLTGGLAKLESKGLLWDYDIFKQTTEEYIVGSDGSKYGRGKSGGIGGGGTGAIWDISKKTTWEESGYTDYVLYVMNGVDKNETGVILGPWFYISDCAQAGKGGIVRYKNLSNIHAYNGSYITTKDTKDMTQSERINTQALIYAQVGFNVKKVRETFEVKEVISRTGPALITEWNKYNNGTYRNIDYNVYNTYGLGIGSGAGGSQEIDGNGQLIKMN